MLCKTCHNMLRRQDGRTWKGTYDLHFQHHTSESSLLQSVEQNCGICRVLDRELQNKTEQATASGTDNGTQQISTSNQEPSDIARSGRSTHSVQRSSTPGGPRFSISAMLSVLDHPRVGILYQLDFKLRQEHVRARRTFILRPGYVVDPGFRTQKSTWTSSDEVFQLLMDWIHRCKSECGDDSKEEGKKLICGQVNNPEWYPARLIDLSNLKQAGTFQDRMRSQDFDPSKATVRLVETADWKQSPSTDERYVTLSHCWGQNVDPKSKAFKCRLRSDNIEGMKEAIPMDDLPKTFQDAIVFAARLPRVGYIWIDSLCIKQGKEEEKDWLEQSALMHKVYSETYLNISATASKDSEGGLFRKRDPALLLEDQVTLNIEGLPGAHPRQPPSQDAAHTNSPPSTSTRRQPPHDLKYCTILDASFWSERIDHAPVNQRAWVLQERLMSPRVLHFCGDQIAWECCGFDAAEGLPEGMPNFQLTSGGVIEESRLKGLEVTKDGQRLRNIRLGSYRDPDLHLRPKVYALELWRRIVEVYTKTAITNDDDKLIALSGMARLMAEKIGSCDEPAKYAAGLWQDHLASQLLWQVEPVWREADGVFQHLSKTPKKYRAPSWSWAAVNANKGLGVVCADITDKDLFISIAEVSIVPRDMDNVFGIVKERGTYLDLWGKLRKAELYKKDEGKFGRFGWRLLKHDGYQEEHANIYLEEHTNVYLDCPKESQRNEMFGKDDRVPRVYVIPAAKGPRTAFKGSKYLTCLLVQYQPGHEGGPVFRRIGLSRLSPWGDKEALARLLDMPTDRSIPSLGYDPVTGRSRIRLV